MDCAQDTFISSSFHTERVGFVAAIKTLEILEAPNTYAELSRKSNWLIDEMRQSAGQNGIPLQTNVMGGMFGFFFAEKPVRNYQDAAESDQDRFRKFFMGMLKEGIYLAPSAFESGFISMAHTEEDLEKTAAACRKVMATLWACSQSMNTYGSP